MTRRRFLGTSAASSAVASAATAEPRIKLGYDAYSIRDLRWKDIQHIDYAVSLKLDAIQFSMNDFASLEPAHLHKVRDYAADKGIEISAATGCICTTTGAWRPENKTPDDFLVRGAAVAKELGCNSIRVYIGETQDRYARGPAERHVESTLKALRAARSRVQDLGIRVSIENHKDLTARELRSLVEAAGADWVGVNYDSANPVVIAEDPALALDILAPHVITSHFRDSVVFEHPRGAVFQWVAIGDGCVNLPGVVESYKRLCPGRTLLLEIITGRPPAVIPYYEDDWWKGFQKLPAADFVRFVNLAKHGSAYMGTMVIGAPGANGTLRDALREQQRLDLERSLKYCQEKLGLGVRAHA